MNGNKKLGYELIIAAIVLGGACFYPSLSKLFVGVAFLMAMRGITLLLLDKEKAERQMLLRGLTPWIFRGLESFWMRELGQ